jgi:DNA-binding MarR family transcriptional regulator
MTSNYLQFLNYFEKQINDTGLEDLHLHRLLEVITLYNETYELPIRCVQLLTFRDLGSPATIHKNYQHLIELGYLKHSYSKSDRRIKYIEITEKTKNHFGRLSDAMAKIVAKNKR